VTLTVGSRNIGIPASYAFIHQEISSPKESSIIEPFAKSFDKIYIDEAHHIYTPEIYSDFPEIEACDRCSIGHRYLDRRWYREGFRRTYESGNIYSRKGLFYRLVKLIW
jgi:hypothetical protein